MMVAAVAALMMASVVVTAVVVTAVVAVFGGGVGGWCVGDPAEKMKDEEAQTVVAQAAWDLNIAGAL